MIKVRPVMLSSRQGRKFDWGCQEAEKKIGALLKICLFAWYIEVFWILIKRTISEHLCKI